MFCTENRAMQLLAGDKQHVLSLDYSKKTNSSHNFICQPLGRPMGIQSSVRLSKS